MGSFLCCHLSSGKNYWKTGGAHIQYDFTQSINCKYVYVISHLNSNYY